MILNFIAPFIHPELRNPANKDHKKAVIFVVSSLLISVFLLFYDLYFFIFYPDNTFKNITNVTGTLFLFIGVVNFRFSKNLKKSLAVFMILVSPFSFVSIYHTGGIYSVDNIWLLVVIVTAYLFSGNNTGNFMTSVVILFLLILFFLDVTGKVAFKEYVIANTSIHNIFTYCFVSLLIATLLISFNKVLQKSNEHLTALKEQKIEALEEKIKQKTEELSLFRQKLAQDFHDEMGNKLASISLLSQSVGLKLNQENKSEEISSLLSNIDLRSKELYHGTKDFIWSIDLKSDYCEELFLYVRDFGETFFESLQLSFYSEIQNQNKLSRLPSMAGRQLVYVCKEIMTNAAKHANCTEIQFTFKTNQQHLELTIADNGKGFNYETSLKRGLKNVQDRVNLIGGVLRINSSQKGSSFIITIPLEKETLPDLGSTSFNHNV